MKKVFVLGSTGSIGINCLNVISNLKHDFEVTGLTVNSNIELLLEQIREFNPKVVAVRDEGAAKKMSGGIKGGGCSGLSHTFSWEKEARTGDEVFEGPGGAKIFVDKKSLLYLNGTTLEYDSELMGKGLHFINPNAKASCGCGSSFTV